MSQDASLFATTHWSVVVAAGDAGSPQAREALERLCQSYWYPLYAYVRRLGRSPHDAQDLTQEFFLQLLEHRYLARADPRKGRFRSFLLVGLNHFLTKEWHRAHALKRGGGFSFLSWEQCAPEERYRVEPFATENPEHLFEQRWAMTVIEQAVSRLRREFMEAGRKKEFATGDFDGRVRIWDSASGRLIAGPLRHEKEVTALAFSPDDKWLVSASQDGTARFWQATDGAAGPVFRHEGGLRAMLLSPDGSHLATAGDDRAVRVWAVAIGARVAEFKHAGPVNCVAFSPDGRTLAAGDQTGQVRFWDVTTGYESGVPIVHAGQVFSVCFRRDGRVLVTGSVDQTARVWDVQTRRAVSRPLAHRDAVASASFSPDGRHVLTASFDHTARVWDMATGHPICDALMHGNRVVGAEWRPDGRSVLTASWDGSARVWAMPLLKQTPDSRWLADTAEAVVGLKLAHDEIRQEMTPGALEALRSGKRASAGDTQFLEWAQWLFAERQTRPVAPGLRMSAAEYVRARLDDTRADRVREKLRFTPMNGVALAHWSRLVLQQNRERNPRWLGESTFAAELAAKLAPESYEPWWSLAEVKLRAGQAAAAREAFLRVRERLPNELSARDGAELESLRHRLNVEDAPINPPKK